MSKNWCRRDVLKRMGVIVGAAVGLGGGTETWIPTAHAADLPRVDPKEPMAQALAYHVDAATVDAKAFPSYAAGQKCSTCAQLQGQDGDEWRPCALFPNELVNANGWCRAWTAKDSGPD
jgi:hypothetical protein